MIFSKKKEEQKLKEILLQKCFSSKEHKKIIKEAIIKSSEDQRALSRRYNEAVKIANL